MSPGYRDLTTSIARYQAAPKPLVTIEELAIRPGQGLARGFPRTEEARGSNPLTSTIETPPAGPRPGLATPVECAAGHVD